VVSVGQTSTVTGCCVHFVSLTSDYDSLIDPQFTVPHEHVSLLNSGYISNKTEIKLKQNNFV